MDLTITAIIATRVVFVIIHTYVNKLQLVRKIEVIDQLFISEILQAWAHNWKE